MVEFRLYYDDNGKVICYTCDKLEGNYIVIDAQTYAESRPDLRIVDGKIIKASEYMILSKLVKSIKGIKCDVSDICVITNTEPSSHWEVEINEYRQN